jgi:putative Mg2+ transporter-C (MgtC) family protein
MAAGAGLLLLACAVVALHFVSALAYSRVERQLTGRLRGTVRLHILYDGGQGVLVCGQRKWHIYELDSAPLDVDLGQVGVTITLSGIKIMDATEALAGVDGVAAVLEAAKDPE